MLKTQPLCTSAESNLRVWGEEEENSFIALPGQGGDSRLVPPKNHLTSNPGGTGEELLERLKAGAAVQGVCRARTVSCLRRLLLLVSCSGSSDLASGVSQLLLPVSASFAFPD